MKKLIAVLLAVIMLSMLIAACGGETAHNGLVTSEEVQESGGFVTEKEQAIEEPAEKSEEVTVDEIVVYDDNNFRITATGMEESWTGKCLKLLVENHTDRNIALTGMDVIVNGITMNGYLYIDVAAEKKANGVLEIYTDSLQVAGIEQIATVNAVDAYIYDTDSYETIVNTPFAVTTSLGAEYRQALDETGDVLYESNGVAVISKIISDGLFGKTVLLYVRNESGKNVIIQGENISVNGFTIDAWLYDNVYADTVRFCGLDIFTTALEENGITEIEDVSFTISIIDPQSFNTIASSDEIQIYVNE